MNQKVSKDVIEECAHNLMFELGEGQADLIAEEFDTVMDQIDFLSKIPGIDDAQPMTFPYKLHRSEDFLRDDVPQKPLKPEEALANSRTRLGNQIRVPRVVAHGEKNPLDEGEE